MEATAGAGLRDPARAADSFSRRADVRRGSDRAAYFLGSDLSVVRCRAHDFREHALYGRSGVLPSAGADGSRADHCAGDAGGIEGVARVASFAAARSVGCARQHEGAGRDGRHIGCRRVRRRAARHGGVGSERDPADSLGVGKDRDHCVDDRADPAIDGRRVRGKDRRGGEGQMNLRRLQAVTKKEMLHIVRDVRSLILALAQPLMMLLLFGYALTLDVDRIPTYIYDLDRTPESRDLIDHFRGSKYFEIRSVVDNYRTM